jgi:hypothetical protein
LTRREADKLGTILHHLHLGRIHYAEAMMSVIDLIEIAEREHAAEDMVNASLEQSTKGTGDDRSV